MQVLDYVDSLSVHKDDECGDELALGNGIGDEKIPKKKKSVKKKKKKLVVEHRTSNVSIANSETENTSSRKKESIPTEKMRKNNTMKPKSSNEDADKKSGKKHKNNRHSSVMSVDSGAADQPSSLERQGRHHNAVGAVRVRGVSPDNAHVVEEQARHQQQQQPLESDGTAASTTSGIHLDDNGTIQVHATLVVQDEDDNEDPERNNHPETTTIPTLVKAEQVVSSNNKNKNWKLYAIIVLLLLLVIGMAIGIPLSLRSSNTVSSSNAKDSNDQASESEEQVDPTIDPAVTAPSPSPIAATELPPADLPPVAPFGILPPLDDDGDGPGKIPLEILSSFQALSGPGILKEGTPQYKAVQYLLNDPFLAEFDEWAFAQTKDLAIMHYVILVLYFSTGGETTWKEQLNFLSYSSFCEWHVFNYPVDGKVSGVQCSPQDGTVTSIVLDMNGVSGTIPAELGALTNLSILELAGAGGSMVGSIPPSLGSLTKLEELNLHHNRLTGTIPPVLGNLKELKKFSVFENAALGGDFPSTFAESYNLELVRLEGTRIYGNMDDIFCTDASRGFVRLIADCGTDRVECCCCTGCCEDEQHCDINSRRTPTCQG
ncbi:MAG: hypothetical protein SGILL_005575 [Bacillariaceae sp.]